MLEFDRALFDDNNAYLTFKMPKSVAAKFLEYLGNLRRDKKQIGIKIEEIKKARSLDANAYFWQLVGRMAGVLLTSRDEVYRQLVRDYGACDYMEINKDALETFKSRWEMNGVAYIVEKVDDSPTEGYVRLNVYTGSSKYTTKEMARLIDGTIQECKQLGIETITPAEVARLMEQWEARQGK